MKWIGRQQLVFVFFALSIAWSRLLAATFVYVADEVSRSVHRFDSTGTSLGPIASNIQATGLAQGPDGFLYISEGQNNEVHRYNQSTGEFVDVFVSSSTGFKNDLVFGADGDLYVTDFQKDAVLRFDGSSGASKGTFATVDEPNGLVFGADGDLYVSTLGITHDIVRISASSGNVVETFTGVFNPHKLTLGPDNNIYIATAGSAHIVRLQDGAISTFSSGHNISQAKDVEFTSDGDLLVMDRSADEVLLFDGQTGVYKETLISGSPIEFGVGLFSPVPEPQTYGFIVGVGVLTLACLRRASLNARNRRESATKHK